MLCGAFADHSRRRFVGVLFLALAHAGIIRGGGVYDFLAGSSEYTITAFRLNCIVTLRAKGVEIMGQGANSGRHASLDDKKERSAGRKQNDPATQAITGRQEAPKVAGAFGREGRANRRGGRKRKGRQDRRQVRQLAPTTF